MQNNFRERAKQFVSEMTLKEMLKQMRYNALTFLRFEIPACVFKNECFNGVARSGTSNVFHK